MHMIRNVLECIACFFMKTINKLLAYMTIILIIIIDIISIKKFKRVSQKFTDEEIELLNRYTKPSHDEKPRRNSLMRKVLICTMVFVLTFVTVRFMPNASFIQWAI
jgi:hypothetical protein